MESEAGDKYNSMGSHQRPAFEDPKGGHIAALAHDDTEIPHTGQRHNAAVITAEMGKRQDKLMRWKSRVSSVVCLSFIVLKYILVLLAILLFPGEEVEDEKLKKNQFPKGRKNRKLSEVARAVFEWDQYRVWTGFITDEIVDVLAHTGLKVCGITIFSKQLPDTAEETRAFLGDSAARECWPAQKEMTISWWNQFMATGSVDLKALREITWVQRLEWAFLTESLCKITAPYTTMLCDKFFSVGV